MRGDAACMLGQQFRAAQAGAAAARVHGATPPHAMLTPTFSTRLQLDALALSHRGHSATGCKATPHTLDGAVPAPHSALRAPPALCATASPVPAVRERAAGVPVATAGRRSASASSVSRGRLPSLAGARACCDIVHSRGRMPCFCRGQCTSESTEHSPVRCTALTPTARVQQCLEIYVAMNSAHDTC